MNKTNVKAKSSTTHRHDTPNNKPNREQLVLLPHTH